MAQTKTRSKAKAKAQASSKPEGTKAIVRRAKRKRRNRNEPRRTERKPVDEQAAKPLWRRSRGPRRTPGGAVGHAASKAKVPLMAGGAALAGVAGGIALGQPSGAPQARARKVHQVSSRSRTRRAKKLETSERRSAKLRPRSGAPVRTTNGKASTARRSRSCSRASRRGAHAAESPADGRDAHAGMPGRVDDRQHLGGVLGR